MTKRIGRIAVAAALLGLATLAVAEDLATVEQKIQAAWGKHKSVTAKMTMAGNMGAGPQTGTLSGGGTLEIVRQGDKTLSHFETKTKMTYQIGDQKQEMEQDVTMIVDGEYAYTLSKYMGQTTAMKMDVDPLMTYDPKATFEQMKKNFDLKVLPEAKIDGVKCFVIEATPKEGSQQPGMNKMVTYYDQGEGFSVKSVTFGPDGKEMMTTTFSEIKYDVSIDPKRFVFEAPAGVTVMDQTTKGKK